MFNPGCVCFFFEHGNRTIKSVDGLTRYFIDKGLFKQSSGDDTEFKSAQQQIDDNYDNYYDIALSMAEGDMVKADQLLNVGIFEFYYRLLQYNNWAKKREKK